MSGRESIFADDWRDSLREHYKDVVRRNDKGTEATLVGVMYDVGFREEDLRQLKLEATMRADDLASDFVPDLEVPSPIEVEARVQPGVDVQASDVEEIDTEATAPFEDEFAEDEAEKTIDDATPNQVVDADGDEPDPNAPQQMSLF